ncbi:hemerythrin domain-containing protein [Mycolicibacterium celeriflavum]|uniref:Hemerythrin n=1 Tax=Mycolicibacterium celeriflavum TaxID=1249101 RepID=A0A1X0BTS0_MYCCF|nr:hemerythrin domain-containing protein [Mycolicibacterium celeriflavum]MCV7239284.1 hemerythrin domain-containing protein [Mycolicibacterium celeriflavum]ORA46992.1 hemerythrin [Mycolicibacterium celeriflavum]BBY44586.1 hemerythrin [Mycolicibacterium celeriflavum]
MPLIRDYIAEHARVLNLGAGAVRAIDRGDLDSARRLLAEMASELKSHWRGEENGLFKVMAREELFAEHIDPLIREHRELNDLLATVDLTRPDDQAAIRDAMEELWEHTRKEEDGIFPAALTSLDGDAWDAAIEAWHEAHPDREMVKWSV